MNGVYTATSDHIHVLIVESSLWQSQILSVMFVFTLVQSRSRVDTVQKCLEDFANWRHICWSYTTKALGSRVTFVWWISSKSVALSYTCSDMKVWSRMFAMNVRCVSVQHLNWNVISQFTLTTNSSVVSYSTHSSNVSSGSKDTTRSVLLFTVSSPLCCDYEQCVCATIDDISWQINSVCGWGFALLVYIIKYTGWPKK